MFFPYKSVLNRFSVLSLVFNFLAKEYLGKAARKMLMLVKLKPAVNFTNILWVASMPISCGQKITKPNCKHIKALRNIFAQRNWSKIKLLELPPVVNFANILWAAFGLIFLHQKIKKSQTVIKETLRKPLSCKNVRLKCWLNWYLV
jgi:hypothetical protein